MKTVKYLLLITSLIPLGLNASYSLPSGSDFLTVFIDSSSSLVWQSNILYDDKTEEEELMWIINPGIEAVLGGGESSFDASFQVNYEIQRFEELFELSGEYLHLDAKASYDGARLDVNAAYSLDEQQTTAGQQGTEVNNVEFIEIDLTRAHLMGEYTLSPRFSFESGVRHSNREFKNQEDRLADTEAYSIPLNLYYELTPKVDLSVGYEYSFEKVSQSGVDDYNRNLTFLNIGARGKLMPKLEGSFRVGFNTVNPEGTERESRQTMGLRANLAYFLTPKLTSRLLLRRGFDVGSEGQSLETTSARLDFDYKISTNYIANVFMDLSYQDFRDGNEGKDFINRSGFRISYLPNQYWRLGTGYAYSENDSNRTGQGFVNHALDLSASLRY